MPLFFLSPLPIKLKPFAVVPEYRGDAFSGRTEPCSIGLLTSQSYQAATGSATSLRFGMGSILFFSLVIAVACMIAGCGKKGPPVAPRQADPPEVTDLNTTVDGDTLKLTWTIKKPLPRGLAGFFVYRSKTALSEPVCETCPIIFQRVADIPFEGNGTKNFKEGKMTYMENLEKGYKYIYKVNAYMEDERPGKDSNPASVIY